MTEEIPLIEDSWPDPAIQLNPILGGDDDTKDDEMDPSTASPISFKSFEADPTDLDGKFDLPQAS